MVSESVGGGVEFRRKTERRLAESEGVAILSLRLKLLIGCDPTGCADRS
jgi:hypothetical protein